jgi:hypothetical protein
MLTPSRTNNLIIIIKNLQYQNRNKIKNIKLLILLKSMSGNAKKFFIAIVEFVLKIACIYSNCQIFLLNFDHSLRTTAIFETIECIIGGHYSEIGVMEKSFCLNFISQILGHKQGEKRNAMAN